MDDGAITGANGLFRGGTIDLQVTVDAFAGGDSAHASFESSLSARGGG